ncbi:MAG: hypothetical protein JXR88_07105 [Clostridia bacterium]|nr:hypothetical protein [Clostridia bacterium]
MITVNDKLRLFSKRIVEKRQLEYDAKVVALEEKMASEFASRQVLLEKERMKYEDSLLKGVKKEKHQRLANARSEKKRRLLLKKRTMIDTLLEGVKTYAQEFVNSEAYFGYLGQVIEKHYEIIAHLGHFEVYLNQKDYHDRRYGLSKVFKHLGLSCDEFHVYEKPIIGGMILMKKDQTTRLDLSIDSVIEDNRRYMGQLIYNILEEAGEFSEK